VIKPKLSLPELILFSGTRVALGIGIGPLLAGRLTRDQRKAAGLSLALVGGLPTIPLVIAAVGEPSALSEESRLAAQHDYG
jgi:hypothetical protein